MLSCWSWLPACVMLQSSLGPVREPTAPDRPEVSRGHMWAAAARPKCLCQHLRTLRTPSERAGWPLGPAAVHCPILFQSSPFPSS